MSLTQRLQRLEGQLPAPEPEITMRGWCDRDGAPCEPPEDVRRQAEDAATEPWRAAVWVPEQRLVMLLRADRYEFQIVELQGDDGERGGVFKLLEDVLGTTL
jgi:hypothetical protein